MSDTVAYPPGPDPESLSLRFTAVPRHVKVQETLLLGGLMLFLFAYLSLLAACTFGIVWLASHLGEAETPETVAFIIGIAICTGIIGYLIWGLLRSSAAAKPSPAIEIKAEEQTALFAFLRRVADDAGADFPRKVFLTADVNAAVMPYISLASLVRPPSHDLYLGLGLVNSLNLSEFQAVLAHEFGHAAHRGPIDGWARGVDVAVERFFTGSRILQLFHRSLTSAKRQLIREREFHADRIAASVAGSNSLVHALVRAQFGTEAWARAAADLQRAAESNYYSSDLYFHQHAACDILRREGKDPNRGQPPGEGETAFDPAFDDPGGLHPGHSEREANLKEKWVPAIIDERTPWLLFRDANTLRRQLTASILKTWPSVPANASLMEPREVQAFLDAERNWTSFDPKYRGAYDGRALALQPQELNDLLALTRTETWGDERLRKVAQQHEEELPARVARRAKLAAQRQRHLNRSQHDDARHAMSHLRDLDDRIDRVDAWFHGFDRRTALVHWQMAAQLGEDRFIDIMERYRFHLAVQELATTARRHADLVRLHARLEPRRDPFNFGELVAVLRSARKALTQVLHTAKELNLPAMRHFEETEQLTKYLLDESPQTDLPAGPLKEEWIRKLLRQLERTQSRCERLQSKSLAALLLVQDQIAADYLNAVAV